MSAQNDVLSPAAAVREITGLAPAVFTAALFGSAFLLFWIEPLIARMLLPHLGGSQSVWNICLVFFQAILLLGYTYAYVLTRFSSLRQQVIAHTIMMAAGAGFLPVVVASDWSPSTADSPVLALFGILLLLLGLPFFALSANAPLLQQWYGAAAGRRARNPFLLYAVSNAGSLAALLAYPVIVEPNLTLSRQTALWTDGYFALIGMIVLAGFLAAFGQPDRQSAAVTSATTPAPAWPLRLKWLVYAALPSSLLLGVTGYVTADVAPFPFLWILPLSLYLLSFILTFSERRLLDHALAIKLLPLAIILAGAGFLVSWVSLLAAVCIEFAAYFLIAIVCNGELARTKPHPDHLTEFYFWLSLGGVVGGVLTVLVSPLLFKDFVEYPLALSLTCLLMPGEADNRQNAYARWIMAGAIIIVVIQPFASINRIISGGTILVGLVLAGYCAAAAKPRNPLLIALALLLALQSERLLLMRYGSIILRDRSFYGVYTVTEDQNAGYRMMFHGPTLHGVELIDPKKYQPLTYYAAKGPLGDVMRNAGRRSKAVAVIGLGIGSTGCYATAGQSWTFYELDPLVEEIATDSGLFHSLDRCVPKARIVLGDGRLKLAEAGHAKYDLLILDAFSSDAIPVHLLTREAFNGYASALKAHGVMAIHITNRHFDLAPVISRAAPEAGFVTYERDFTPPSGTDPALISPSRWMVLARNPNDLRRIVANPGWQLIVPGPDTKLWTDDYSNVLSALK
jgi:spermidine synthase